jgi:hypothetical protein
MSDRVDDATAADAVTADARLRDLLGAVSDGDERGASMTNQLLVEQLGWAPGDVASMLSDAKDQLLIWGLKTGGTPQPHFEDIELTVQGRRFLRSPRPT